jgi:hypothetical protein
MCRTPFYVLLVIVLSANFSAADENKDRTITTSGEAVVYVKPDEVVFQFGVETRDQSLDKAESLNDETAAKLVAAVKKLGRSSASKTGKSRPHSSTFKFCIPKIATCPLVVMQCIVHTQFA